MRETVAVAVVDLVLAAAGDKTDGTRVVLQIANEGAGNAFFRHALGFFFLVADLHNAVP